MALSLLSVPRIASFAPVPAPHRLPARQQPEPVNEAEPGPSFRKAAIAGIVAITIGFGGFMSWALSAQLDSAALAAGTVIVSSKRKTVSHLEGGILKRVLAAEGDLVKEGQPLLELDDTRARADLAQLEGARIGFLARLARLRAEQHKDDKVAFPDELLSSQSSLARSVVGDETRLFEKRRQLLEGKIEAQRRQIEQADAEARAAGAMAEAAERQRVLMSDQLEKIRGLATKGYATWRSASDLDTQLSQVIGNVGQYTAEKAKAEQAKAAAEIGVLAMEVDWQQAVAADIQDTQIKLNDAEQKIVAARDILSRLIVRSPQDGAVLDLQVRTPGSAVGAGQKLLDIVPEDQQLVVEARLAVRDIDSVRVGAPTQVRLTAYGQRVLAPLDGTLTYVGADQTVDQQSGSVYYAIRASIDPESLKRHPSVNLVPGMPAELVVKHMPRKAIDYILEPITDTFQRAFREE